MMKIVAGNSNRPLAEAICSYLNTPMTKAVVKRFNDMEIFVEIQENVRGQDMFVVQSTSFPANDHLMELLLITRAGADRVLTMDLHANQIQGFFDIPTDNLFAGPVMVRDIKNHLDVANTVIVSPDVGGVVRARALAKRLDTPLAIVDKRRERAGESEVMNIIGDVKGKSCILIDDIVDSGGTLVNAAEALLAQGAKDVTAYITHGVLSGGAVSRITNSKLKELVITDSIQPTEAVKVARNIRTMPVASLIGEAIGRTNREESVSSLFE